MTEPTTKSDFKRQVAEWAARLDVEVNVVAVRAMRNKWASCSTEGNLTFNAELLEFEDPVRSYVIVHELLHFFVPNHGPLWKSLMRAHLGPYEDLDRQLRRHYEMAMRRDPRNATARRIRVRQGRLSSSTSR